MQDHILNAFIGLVVSGMIILILALIHRYKQERASINKLLTTDLNHPISILLIKFDKYCEDLLNKTTIGENINEQLLVLESDRAKLSIYVIDLKKKLKSNKDVLSEIETKRSTIDTFLVKKKYVLENMIPKEPYIHPMLS